MRYSDQILNEEAGKTPNTTIPATTIPPTTVPPTTEPPADPEEDIAEERLIASLKKRGIDVDSLDKLKKPSGELTEEQKLEAEKARKEKSFKFGIEKNIFSQDLYDQFVIDSARPKEDIAFELFKSDFLETIKGTEDADSYNDDDIKDLFDAQYFVGDADGSPRRKLGNKKIAKTTEDYLQSKYGNVLKADNELSAWEEEEKNALQYKGVVDKAFDQLPPKLSYIIDGITVDFQPTAEILQSVKELYTNEKAYKNFAGATPETIIEAVKVNIAQKDLNRLLSEAAQTYHAQKVRGIQMGRIGALPDRGIAGQVTGGKKYADLMLDANKKA